MKISCLTGLKAVLCAGLIWSGVTFPLPGQAENLKSSVRVSDEPPVSLTEVRYQKLMRTYLNKIKLAFSQPDDTQSLEILSQFSNEFSQKTDNVKKELEVLVKEMDPEDAEALYARLRQQTDTEELVALLFDERITTRMAANPELKDVMDQLHAKSLEVQKSGREFIAADK